MARLRFFWPKHMILAAGFFVLGVFTISAEEDPFASGDVITKDVAIIGGGAAGTYAAVRLREDYGKSVVLVEKQDHLGGHVVTYKVPNSDTSLEYGVQSYLTYGKTKEFFGRFNISTETAAFGRKKLTQLTVDVATGQKIDNYVTPSSEAQSTALKGYQSLCEKYENLTNPGYFNFPASNAIPTELLTPFGELAAQYGIMPAVPFIMVISNAGVGGIRQDIALNVMKSFGAPIIRDVLGGTSLIPKPNNSYLYDLSRQLLGPDVLLSTTVVATRRDASGVKLAVVDTQGHKKVIVAKRLFIAIQPTPQNMKPFELDESESRVFQQLPPAVNYVGIMRSAPIPDNYSITFIPAAAAPDNYLAVRDYPYTLRFDYTGSPGLYRVLFAANVSISVAEAQDIVRTQVGRLVSMGTMNGTAGAAERVEFVAFADHNVVRWPERAAPYREGKGFVAELYALQGRRSTWFTGALWTGQAFSSVVWAFTDQVLPKLVQGL